jgi:predicted lipoprotein with Yx(FWY)xxD motif
MSRTRTKLAASALALAAAGTTAAATSTAVASPTSASASRAPAHAAAAPAKIQLRHTSKGTILVNGRGFTLYAFLRDGRNQDRCVAISGCKSTWPLVTTNGRPVAAAGVRSSLLGTIRVGNVTQVTYAGHPLYTYSGDSSAGETSYIGFKVFGAAWDALTASGGLVR